MRYKWGLKLNNKLQTKRGLFYILLVLFLSSFVASGTLVLAADKALKGKKDAAASKKSPAKADDKGAAKPAEPSASVAPPIVVGTKFEPMDGSTQYTAVGKPSLLKIKGTIPQVKGEIIVTNDKKVSGKLNIDLKGLDSKISFRDDHTRKYLEVEKYPQATLALNEMELPITLKDMKDPIKDQKFTGNLTFHNETKPIEGTYTLERKENTYTVKAQYVVMWPDYKIEIPVYAGITMQPKVEVETTFSIKVP